MTRLGQLALLGAGNTKAVAAIAALVAAGFFVLMLVMSVAQAQARRRPTHGITNQRGGTRDANDTGSGADAFMFMDSTGVTSSHESHRAAPTSEHAASAFHVSSHHGLTDTHHNSTDSAGFSDPNDCGSGGTDFGGGDAGGGDCGGCDGGGGD